jgi:hypothetical protein
VINEDKWSTQACVFLLAKGERRWARNKWPTPKKEIIQEKLINDIRVFLSSAKLRCSRKWWRVAATFHHPAGLSTLFVCMQQKRLMPLESLSAKSGAIYPSLFPLSQKRLLGPAIWWENAQVGARDVSRELSLTAPCTATNNITSRGAATKVGQGRGTLGCRCCWCSKLAPTPLSRALLLHPPFVCSWACCCRGERERDTYCIASSIPKPGHFLHGLKNLLLELETLN